MGLRIYPHTFQLGCMSRDDLYFETQLFFDELDHSRIRLVIYWRGGGKNSEAIPG